MHSESLVFLFLATCLLSLILQFSMIWKFRGILEIVGTINKPKHISMPTQGVKKESEESGALA